MSKFWKIKNSETEYNVGELHIYSEISSETWWGDEVTPKDFKADLDGLGDVDRLNVFINSPGGDVFAGQAIYSMLKRHKARVYVYIDGLAASIASVIAMAGDKILMPKNAMMMIHNPMVGTYGNAKHYRKWADDLDKICESMKAAYLEKAKDLDEGRLTELLDAETWLTAQECLDFGFADEVDDVKNVAACIDRKYINSYKNIPKEIIRDEPIPKELIRGKGGPKETIRDEPDEPPKEYEPKIAGKGEDKEKLLLEIDLI